MQNVLPMRRFDMARLRNLSKMAFVLLTVMWLSLGESNASGGQGRRGFRAPMAREQSSHQAAPVNHIHPPQTSHDPGTALATQNHIQQSGTQPSRLLSSDASSKEAGNGEIRLAQNQGFGQERGRGPGQSGGLIDPNHPRQAQQHLSEWMQSHQKLSLDQQQRALEAEPGFRQLPPQAQQRLHMRLQQLNNMSPEQRTRVTQRTEAMERLTPPQRQQVRDAYAQLGALPEDRRRAVARTFNSMLAMPASERGAYFNSPQVRGQLNDHERDTLDRLLTAPYLPEPGPLARPPQPYQPQNSYHR
jgi:hypothetical protein